MKSPLEIKRMARKLVEKSKKTDHPLKHNAALNQITKDEGHTNWQTYKATWKNR